MNDLDDMNRALRFAAKILRDELGPGGIMQGESSRDQAIWDQAASFLETTTSFPMIPLYFWRHMDETPGGDGSPTATGRDAR